MNFLSKQWNWVPNLIPIIQQILHRDLRIIRQHATVDDPIPAFSDHILVGQPVRRILQLPQRVPMPPPKMRHLRRPSCHRRRVRRRRRPALPTRLRRRTVREHDPVLGLPYINLDLRDRRLRHPLLRRRHVDDLLDLLRHDRRRICCGELLLVVAGRSLPAGG